MKHLGHCSDTFFRNPTDSDCQFDVSPGYKLEVCRRLDIPASAESALTASSTTKVSCLYISMLIRSLTIPFWVRVHVRYTSLGSTYNTFRNPALLVSPSPQPIKISGHATNSSHSLRPDNIDIVSNTQLSTLPFVSGPREHMRISPPVAFLTLPPLFLRTKRAMAKIIQRPVLYPIFER